MPHDANGSTYSKVDISSLTFWQKPFDEREKSFAKLRAEDPVSWNAPLEQPRGTPPGQGSEGYWAVTRAKDINFVSQTTDLFISGKGLFYEPIPLELQQLLGFIIAMDAPRHTAYRQLFMSAFTPRAIARLNAEIVERARKIVDNLISAGNIDFVHSCSRLLPMQTISDMLGVPPSEQEEVARMANVLAGADDDEFRGAQNPMEARRAAFEYLRSVGMSVAEHRRRQPADDMMTSLVQANIEGHTLTDDDIGSFMVQMAAAGNDTTMQTTSHTMISLARNPDQRDWLMEDFDARIGNAIEEFIRHATPISAFSRTVVKDAEINGISIAEGDKVVMFYCSGNRDPEVCTSPEKFDLSRKKSPHVAFGGGGPHFCLGAGIARAQLRALFGQLLSRIPKMDVGEPEYLVSFTINGVKRLPVHIQ